MNAIRAIRGMNDILPDETPLWQFFEDTARAVFAGYGYAEIRPPVVERTELFRRSIGEVTDIVEKEMYTFSDRRGESLTLRPECTASCVRAAIEHGLLRQHGLRVWYQGPMFRYERPQKGRYRQFYQVGAEVFGCPEAAVDAELILMSARLWRVLGLKDMRLELNSLGERAEQGRYREALVEYLRARRDRLDEDSLRRLETNPMRVLDSKNPALDEVLAGAPSVFDHLGDDSRRHFDALREALTRAGLEFTVNARLVRGLDYYTRTVFEWVSGALGAQNAACGGGRYDALVAEIGGPATAAVGFSIGVERVLELMLAAGREPTADAPAAYLAAVGEEAAERAHAVSEGLRDAITGLRLQVDAGAGSFKAKMRRAGRSGAAVALLIGPDEARADRVTIKALAAQGEQSTVSVNEAAGTLSRLLAGTQ